MAKRAIVSGALNGPRGADFPAWGLPPPIPLAPVPPAALRAEPPGR
jgi:hypothetical protein